MWVMTLPRDSRPALKSLSASEWSYIQLYTPWGPEKPPSPSPVQMSGYKIHERNKIIDLYPEVVYYVVIVTGTFRVLVLPLYDLPLQWLVIQRAHGVMPQSDLASLQCPLLWWDWSAPIPELVPTTVWWVCESIMKASTMRVCALASVTLVMGSLTQRPLCLNFRPLMVQWHYQPSASSSQ